MRDSANTGRCEAGQCRKDTPSAVITLISGCMFSGKTTELIRRLDTAPDGLTAAFKHSIDRRYRADHIVAHTGKALPAHRVASASEIPGHIGAGVRSVGIDEAHFFDPELVNVVRDLVAGSISVIITALDLDSWGRPFTIIEQLCAIAHEPVALHATCARCSGIAHRTQRITPIVGGQMVGGPESYEARCRHCWMPPPEPPPE